jgi:Protein of unknown function (DUF1574)
MDMRIAFLKDEGRCMSSDLPPIAKKSPARATRWPLGLLGMVVLIVCVESFVMAHDLDFTTLVASNWRIEGEAPAKFASRNEILCFGDSMVKFGIQPKVLGEKVGKKAYNFALYNGSAPSSYYMLKRSFDAGAKPAAIIVDFQPELIMNDSLRIVSRVYPELLSFGEIAELCWKAKNPDRFAEFIVAKILPSARKRYEIQASVQAAIKGESASVKDKLQASMRNWKVNRGAEVLPKYAYFDGHVPTTGAYPAMFWTPWFVDPLNEKYIDRFLKLARSHDVPVFWTLQPNAPEVDAQREKVGYNAQYEAYVKKCLARFTNLVVIDGRHINYPIQIFTDPVHLDKDGATACTLGVADVLRAHLIDHKPGPRWAALPDHRNDIKTIPLEDSIESSLAIKAEEAKVRR